MKETSRSGNGGNDFTAEEQAAINKVTIKLVSGGAQRLVDAQWTADSFPDQPAVCTSGTCWACGRKVTRSNSIGPRCGYEGAQYSRSTGLLLYYSGWEWQVPLTDNDLRDWRGEIEP